MTEQLWNMAVAATEALSPQSNNPSNLSGAVDIIIVKHNENLYKSTPFHVRFGKYLAPFPFNVNVNITINDKKINNLSMTLNKYGIAHFDGPQDEQQQIQQQKEEKAEILNPNDEQQKEDTKPENETPEQKTSEKKTEKLRKRDRLKAFVGATLSYWSGGEEEEDDGAQDKDEEKKNDSKPRKRDYVKNYISVWSNSI